MACQNWVIEGGLINDNIHVECVKPARDGAVLGDTTTPRPEGVGREQLPEPAEVGVWGGSCDRGCSLGAEMQQAQAAAEGKETVPSLTSHPPNSFP